MRVVINKQHLSLNDKLAKEANRIAGKFNNRKYSKIEDIDKILLKRDISVENKKSILIKKLHSSVLAAFSVDKGKFSKKAFQALKKRLHDLRRIIIKLRGINYYLETTFLADSGFINKKSLNKDQILRQNTALARNEMDALEYSAYKLIEKVVVLDKRLAVDYSRKEKKVFAKEMIEIKDLNLILKKESEVLEHLEAKIPPPKAAAMSLMKEPIFTNWVARIFALLSYAEHLYGQDKKIFGKLKKNKSVQRKIRKKIIQIMKEKSKLIRIMEEKAASMRKLRFDKELKKELHNLTTIANL